MPVSYTHLAWAGAERPERPETAGDEMREKVTSRYDYPAVEMCIRDRIGPVIKSDGYDFLFGFLATEGISQNCILLFCMVKSA